MKQIKFFYKIDGQEVEPYRLCFVSQRDVWELTDEDKNFCDGVKYRPEIDWRVDA